MNLKESIMSLILICIYGSLGKKWLMVFLAGLFITWTIEWIFESESSFAGRIRRKIVYLKYQLFKFERCSPKKDRNSLREIRKQLGEVEFKDFRENILL